MLISSVWFMEREYNCKYQTTLLTWAELLFPATEARSASNPYAVSPGCHDREWRSKRSSIAIIKMDIEGAEQFALEGMKASLESFGQKCNGTKPAGNDAI